MSTKRESGSSTKNSFPRGAKVYCWQFLLPISGWIGGMPSEFWHTDQSKVAALMEHCDRPSRIIIGESNGSCVRR